MTEYVTPDDVDELIEDEGFHVRDRNLLLSALAAPLPVFGEEVYPDVHQKAAVLLLAINHNHPLYDGNKRLSWYVVVAFYALNSFDLSVPQVEINRFVRSVADNRVTIDEVVAWLEDHTQPE